MVIQGAGTRHVEGEYEPIHTQIYRCPDCGAVDFSPKMAADLKKAE